MGETLADRVGPRTEQLPTLPFTAPFPSPGWEWLARDWAPAVCAGVAALVITALATVGVFVGTPAMLGVLAVLLVALGVFAVWGWPR